MSSEPMVVTLRRLTGAAFEARSSAAQPILLEGPPSVGGTGQGMRPMEAVLAALAGCSAVDVLMILEQQRQPLTDLELRVHGDRASTVPAVFTSIHVHFVAGGGVDPGKLARAARLSMDKYCSVATMLGAGGVRITHGVSRILGAAAPAGVRIRETEDLAEVGRALAVLGAGPPREPARWLVAERGDEPLGALRVGAAGHAPAFAVVAARDPAIAAALTEATRLQERGKEPT